MKAYSVIIAGLISFAAASPAFSDEGKVAKTTSLRAEAFPNLTLIYRIAGVRDNGGGSDTGTATSFHCTNFTNADQQVRILVRDDDASVAGDNTQTVPSRTTRTWSTHFTTGYAEDFSLATGTVNQGSAQISATNANVHCTAVTIDASASAPIGVSLHMVRFNAAAGTQE